MGETNTQHGRWEIRQGIRDGIPIALGYFFVSFTFGIMGSAEGLRWWETVLLSMTNLTSAGQFAGVKIIATGGTLLELAISQLIINLRYALMGISLSQKTDERFRGASRAILGFAITDEIYGVAINRSTAVSRRYFAGLLILPYCGWSLGTLAGAVLGNVMPATITEAMGLAIYGMFVAIVVPRTKGDRRMLFIVLLTVIFSCLMTYVPVLSGVSVGFSIIICAVLASVTGAVLFPIKEDEHD